MIAVSTGTARASWTLRSALTGGLGFALAAALWWMYFARFDQTVFDRAQRGEAAERRRAFVFGYGHLLVFATLAAVGVGIRLSVEQAIGRPHAQPAARLLGFAVAGAVASLSLVQRAAPTGLPAAALLARLTLVAEALLVVGFAHHLGALAVIGILALSLVTEVAFEASLAARHEPPPRA